MAEEKDILLSTFTVSPHVFFFYPHLFSHPPPYPTGEFANSSGNKVVQWFWELVRSFEQEQKAKLLQFVTGECCVLYLYVIFRKRGLLCVVCNHEPWCGVSFLLRKINNLTPLSSISISYTGTSGVPIQGFSHLQGNDGSIRKFTLHGDRNVKVFPRAHTCFNRIDMPIYKTKAEMQKWLTMAISMESTGFGIE